MESCWLPFIIRPDVFLYNLFFFLKAMWNNVYTYFNFMKTYFQIEICIRLQFKRIAEALGRVKQRFLCLCIYKHSEYIFLTYYQSTFLNDNYVLPLMIEFCKFLLLIQKDMGSEHFLMQLLSCGIHYHILYVISIVLLPSNVN